MYVAKENEYETLTHPVFGRRAQISSNMYSTESTSRGALAHVQKCFLCGPPSYQFHR